MDKGNGVVILDKDVHNQAMYKILSDTTKFKKLKEDVTLKREGQLQRFLRQLKSKGFFNDNNYSNVYPTGSQPARIYGLPKIHKFTLVDPISTLKFRPTASSISTYNYNLAKFLCSLLSLHLPSEFSAQDSFTFVKELNQVSLNGKFLVSFDVTSLFTNIPLNETINLAVDLILSNEPNLKINKDELKKLFFFATAQTHFLFNGDFFDQIDGVAMGSPLAPVLANLFMGYHVKIWLDECDHDKPSYYRRYVDDIFSDFDSIDQARAFFDYLNSKHENIKFTMETECNGKLPFSDVYMDNSGRNFLTNVFHKSTYAGLLTNFLSFTSFSYKVSLIKCLVYRTYKINNTWFSFQSDLDKLTIILKKNLFPSYLIGNIKKKYIKQVQQKCSQQIDDPERIVECTQIVESQSMVVSPQAVDSPRFVEPPQVVENIAPRVRYFKLPYVGKFSDLTKVKLQNIVKKYCKSVSIKIVFTSLKIQNFFSAKDKVPDTLSSNVVYKFKCASCTATYIGETSRHFKTGKIEHVRKDKMSHIYKHHHAKEECFNSYNDSCFSILDTASTKFQLRLKGGMYIGWENPDLNKQVAHVSTTLSI